MQWEIIYVVPGTTDTWQHKPGRIFTPVPRTAKEAGEAVKQILERNSMAVVTITPLPETKPTKP